MDADPGLLMPGGSLMLREREVRALDGDIRRFDFDF
jgi:hypothetical protein